MPRAGSLLCGHEPPCEKEVFLILMLWWTWDKRADVRLGPLIQLLVQVLPDRSGLKPQGVPHEVDTFLGPINQRQIGYRNKDFSRHNQLTGCISSILHTDSQGGKSAVLGTRNFSLRCCSLSCRSRYDATSAEVGLQPSEVATRSTVSLAVEPTSWSITVGVGLGGWGPGDRGKL